MSKQGILSLGLTLCLLIHSCLAHTQGDKDERLLTNVSQSMGRFDPSECQLVKDMLEHARYKMDIGDSCDGLHSPLANAISGGWCQASIAAAGWFRAGTLNPILGAILHTDYTPGSQALVTSSNSGGSMFAVRFFALLKLPAKRKWTFPCYLLGSGLNEVCFFHGDFGKVSQDCEVMNFDITMAASYMVSTPLIMLYGGPFGAFSSAVSVYGPFLSDLPLKNSMDFGTFWNDCKIYIPKYDSPSFWLVAFTLDSPGEAGQPEYSWGWDSFTSRGFEALNPSGTVNKIAANLSIVTVVSISANTLTGINMLPVALTNQGWDMVVTPGVVVLKMFSIALTYVMLKKFVLTHAIVTVMGGVIGSKYCVDGCPAMDGCFSDNGPVTPTLSIGSRIKPIARQTELMVSGPTSTFVMMKYLLGQGPLGIYTMEGINICPFAQPSICTMMGQIRELLVGIMATGPQNSYYAIGSVYQVWNPEAQVLSPFCGNPLVVDEMAGLCKAEGFCSMVATAIPSLRNNIYMTPDPFHIVIAAAFLSASPLAARFVEIFVPSKITSLDYYNNMNQWFPDFSAIAPKTGGVAFTKVAGHLLMDYMTFLAERMILNELEVNTIATKLVAGILPPCGMLAYYDVSDANDLISMY
eukprot:gnl/MRDRNA2_/MRDRNA2_86481_c0_seq1.p1 gnl/MRDRNA2_/MRDRNA2_86481_c0~~gnl/MRDRNA2_/MRDRNA2_86481_c0_seq1.p1  ORF type:complete len:637 (-),score=33.97 gnl/MRDRNA2_/MRDRNA2_86481_c0_seq1:77-1987(-)